MLTVVTSLLLWDFVLLAIFCLFLFVFKMCLKDSLYIPLAVWFIFSNTAVTCYLSHELWGHMGLWVLGQQNTFSSYLFHCVRSLFPVSPWSYLMLDLSLTRLPSLGVKAGIIAPSLLPSRNSTSLHTHLCFSSEFVKVKKMIVGEQKDDVGCLSDNKEKTIKTCMSVKSIADCR